MDIRTVIERLGNHIAEFDKKKEPTFARKAGEALCRILLLNSENSDVKAKANEEKFNTLIESISSKNLGISSGHIKKIQHELRAIQLFGNIGSHDNDEIIKDDEIDKLFQALKNLIQLVFNSKENIYIDQKIPSEIYSRIHKSATNDENWRCDKIVSIVYPNRKVFDRKTTSDFDYFALEEADGRKIGILFLGRNISFRQVFENVFSYDSISNISSLTFLFPIEISVTTGTPVRNRKENIERISKEFLRKVPAISCVYEFIEDYIWDRCLPESAKEIVNPPDEPYFIDQKLHSPYASVLSLDFIESLVKNKLEEKKPIYVIFGDGGAGKTTFCDQAIQLINKYQGKGLRKKAILISSFDIPDEISESRIIVDSLQALYALISENDDAIDSHSLGLNISSGNVLIIIDGLDEIQSKLKERFSLEKFIESVKELNDTYLNCSVILTSREINNASFEIEDVHIFYIKGFDEQLIDKYLSKRFKGADCSKNIEKAKELIAGLGSDSQVTPLILRLASELASEPIKDSLRHQYSSYLKLSEPLDKVVYQLMDREIGKQFLGIRVCDQYFEILRDIVFQYNGQVNEAELLDLVSLALAGTGAEHNEEVGKNYHTSTLLAKTGKLFSLKYDSLEFLIKARYLTYLINNNDSEKDRNILREIEKSCYKGGALVKEISKYKNDDSKYEASLLRSLSKLARSEGDDLHSRKLISALLYINFEGKVAGRDENAKRILDLYAVPYGGEVMGLSIFGEFYPIDFTAFKVRDGFFHGFSSLGKCAIPEDEVVFFSSRFNAIEKKHFGKRNISGDNFDSDCVLCGDLIDVIQSTHDEKEKRREYVISDLKKIFKVGYKSGAFVWKSEFVYKQQCATLKQKISLSNFLSILQTEGFIVKEASTSSSNIGYQLNAKYATDVKEFLTQSLISYAIDQLVSKLLELS